MEKIYILDILQKHFDEQQERLYNGLVTEFTKQEQTEIARMFDEALESNFAFNCLVGAFNSYRHDIITSDREAVAFVLAYREVKKELQTQ